MSPVLIATDVSPTAPSVDLVPPGRGAVAVRRPPSPREEALIVDERSGLRPACVVESKLTRLLKEASLPASRLQMRAMLKAR
ncbi:hypothetical protein [Paludisphaera mucosa]|uniref:Uncharacterized protein n=1 Tax=Paludisphaera mucosa TaxID=3030827 RepID=A0ABT6FK09_9BACT|nr:hypothetical protein [Paludisphaera mucosa]MDG3007911.1 hypothetical protein [Paludisphaera mucosa]